MTNPDVIYKVAVASSNLDIIAIIISAAGVFFSAFLSGILIYQTNKNNKKNKENEEKIAQFQIDSEFRIAEEQLKIQNQSLRIALFDKRITLYEALLSIHLQLKVYRDLINHNMTNFELIRNTYDIINECGEILDKNKLIAEFLLDTSITKEISSISLELRILISRLLVGTKSLYSDEGYAKLRLELLEQFASILSLFESSNIYSKIKPYLYISLH